MPSRTAHEIAPEALQQFHPFGAGESRVSTCNARQQAALETARQLALCLKERFQAKRVMLFGSATRSDFSRWSDIDIAVWGVEPTDYFKAVAYASGFSSTFKVDLVDADDCQPSLLHYITLHGVAL